MYVCGCLFMYVYISYYYLIFLFLVYEVGANINVLLHDSFRFLNVWAEPCAHVLHFTFLFYVFMSSTKSLKITKKYNIYGVRWPT